jgi:phosphoribosyl-AMP cyclohydrolase
VKFVSHRVFSETHFELIVVMSDNFTSIEETTVLKLDFSKLNDLEGCIPVVVQHADTRDVLLIAYTNEKAMLEAFRTKKLILWSTSRNELWEKGATSGCRFDLLGAYVNCEQNSLLYMVRAAEDAIHPGICHTSNLKGEARNCYYRKIDFSSLELENVDP